MSRPNMWAQFDLDQLLAFDLGRLQGLVDHLYGKQPRLNRWRLSVMLMTHGRPFAYFAERRL